MLTDQGNKRAEITKAAAKEMAAARARWLKQLLDWPLKDGPLAGRLTKAEVAALGKAAQQGKLFC